MKLLDKLFGSELKGKYVKYSDATARENPQMILNEYNKVLEQKESELIDLFDNDTYYISIYNCGVKCVHDNTLHYHGIISKELIVRGIGKGIYKKKMVKLHVSKINKVFEEYTKAKADNDKINEEIEAIEEERARFEQDYKYSFMTSGR